MPSRSLILCRSSKQPKEPPTVVYVSSVTFGLAVIEMSESVVLRYVNGKYIRESDYKPPKTTAREGGDILKAAAVSNLQMLINKAQTVGSTCLLSVRHDFPSQWAKFQSVTIGGATPTAELQLTFAPDLYPFWSQGIVGSNPLKAIEFFAEMVPGDKTTAININNLANNTGTKKDSLVKNPLLGNLLAGSIVKNLPLPAAITDSTHPSLTLFFDNNSMEDLWIAITWGK